VLQHEWIQGALYMLAKHNTKFMQDGTTRVITTFYDNKKIKQKEGKEKHAENVFS